MIDDTKAQKALADAFDKAAAEFGHKRLAKSLASWGKQNMNQYRNDNHLNP